MEEKSQSSQMDELIKQLAASLKDRTGADKQLEEVNKLLSQIVPRLEQLQRDVLVLQADMKTQFVTRAEYEPRHQVLLDKIQYYDRVTQENRGQQDRFIRMETAVERLTLENVNRIKDIEELDTRARGALSRSIPIISAVFGILALAVSFLSHVQIH